MQKAQSRTNVTVKLKGLCKVAALAIGKTAKAKRTQQALREAARLTTHLHRSNTSGDTSPDDPTTPLV